MPQPTWYHWKSCKFLFTSPVDKIIMGQLLFLFLFNFCRIFFWYAGGVPETNLFYCYWWYALVCSKLVTKMSIITTGSGWNSLKVIFIKKFLTEISESSHFSLFLCIPCKFKWKYQKYGPCFQTIFLFLMTTYRVTFEIQTDLRMKHF